MSGQKVAGRANFLIGTADTPIDPPAGWKPTRLKAKIEAGAQFAQTQFCMDAAVVRRYTQCLADNGLGSFPLLIGLAPVRSARSARWIRDNLSGLDHSRRRHRAARGVGRSAARRPPDLPRAGRGDERHARGGGRAHHGPGQRCGSCRGRGGGGPHRAEEARASRPPSMAGKMPPRLGFCTWSKRSALPAALRASLSNASQSWVGAVEVGSLYSLASPGPLRRPPSASRPPRFRLQICGITTKVSAMVGYQTFDI